ncbi:MAG: alpha/beta hydrolase [Anaerolineaceae bacterium]
MTKISNAPTTVLSIELASGAVQVQTGGSGPPLLLLHQDVGPMGWGAFQDALAQHFTVFAPDMPGFGDSPRVDWARHPRDLAAIMLALARKVGLKDYTLVGLGFGGWVAAEMASFAGPDLAAMVLSAPAGMRPDETFILDQVMEDPFAYLRSGFGSSAVFETHFPDLKDKDLRARLEQSRETIARVSWKPYMYSYELPETLKEVHVRVTVVWGEKDAVIPPECAGRFARALPRCDVRRLPVEGHFLELEHPVLLASVIHEAFAAATGKR